MDTPSGLTPSQAFQEGVRTAAPFVGRRRYLNWFAQRLEDIRQGRPQVVLLVGDTGIGKTRLLGHVHSLAQGQNMRVYHCRCDEENSVPYLPWVRNLLAEIVQLPTESQGPLQAEVETIRGFLRLQGEAPSTPDLSAEHRKLRLFVAVSKAVIELAMQNPTLIIIDDLHWADGPSLDLFSDLVFAVAGAGTNVPLLLVGTYFPLLATDHLMQAVARYQREQISHSLLLTGLDDLELYRFLQTLGVTHPSQQLVAALRTTTQGNPLFIQEIVHALQHRQALQERGGFLITTIAPEEVRLPTQVTSSITAQLERLSKRTRELLTLAACFGTQFSPERLCIVSPNREDEVLKALAEGVRQKVLRDGGSYVQFAHPLIKHVLYNTPTVHRRQRLHLQLAQALERLHAANIQAGLRELAPHLIRAGLHDNASQAVWYAHQAGDMAFASFAWGEAACHYEAALNAAVSAGISTAQQCAALHYQAGLAHCRARDVGPCLEHYKQAEQIYRSMQDTAGTARLLVEQIRAHMNFAVTRHNVLEETHQLGSLLPGSGEQNLVLRGHIAVVMAELYCSATHLDQAQTMISQALTIAQQTDDPELYAYAYFALGLTQRQCFDSQGALESWQRSLQYARQAKDPWLQGPPLLRRLQLCLEIGQLGEASTTALTARELATQTHDGRTHTGALSALAFVALAQGNFMAVAPVAYEALPMACRSASPWGGVRAVSALACTYALRGEWTAAAEALDLLTELQSVFTYCSTEVQCCSRIFRLWVQAYANLPLAELPEPLAALQAAPPGYEAYTLGLLCALVECEQLQGTPQVAARAYDTLALAVQRGIMFSSASGWLFLLPRVLGVAALLCGQHATAATHLQTALDVAMQAKAEPELGRTYLDYARLLLVQNTASGHQQALASVQQAQRIFYAYSMQPFVQQAAELLHLLQSAQPASQELFNIDLVAGHTYEGQLALRRTQEYIGFLR